MRFKELLKYRITTIFHNFAQKWISSRHIHNCFKVLKWNSETSET